MGTIERDGALTGEDATPLAGAVELYQDGFLEGFHVRRAPAFEAWGLLTRERLRLLDQSPSLGQPGIAQVAQPCHGLR